MLQGQLQDELAKTQKQHKTMQGQVMKSLAPLVSTGPQACLSCMPARHRRAARSQGSWAMQGIPWRLSELDKTTGAVHSALSAAQQDLSSLPAGIADRLASLVEQAASKAATQAIQQLEARQGACLALFTCAVQQKTGFCHASADACKTSSP